MRVALEKFQISRQLLPIPSVTFLFVVAIEQTIHPIYFAFKSALSRAMTERDKKWSRQYDQLVEFKQKKGHCDVPRRHEQDKILGQWVTTQRTNHINNKLRLDRKRLLDEIGFTWTCESAQTTNDKLWHQQCEKLVEFKRKKGHCIVPRYEQDRSLGGWVNNQRTFYRNNKLQQDRKRLLDEIGFVWKADSANNDKLWHQQHEKLVEFKQKNGHCQVPHKYEQDKSLGNWVRKQRVYHYNNKMLPDRKELLDALDFLWKDDADDGTFKPDDKLWHQQYEKLLEYKQINGHCKVSSKCKDDKSLGQWVMTQRARYAKNKMLPDRKNLLDALDFVWKIDSLATRSSATDVRGLAI
jgi:hypothetical protein